MRRSTSKCAMVLSKPKPALITPMLPMIAVGAAWIARAAAATY